MENNNRYSKYIAVIALLISVVGVSLGFAAYSNTVQIKAAADYKVGANPTTKPTEPSTDPDTPTQGPVTPTPDPDNTPGGTAETADVTANGIENIMVHFTAPGQKFNYTFYGVNPTEFVSYLNKIVFGTKTCSPDNSNGNAAQAVYVNGADGTSGACADIHLNVTAGGVEYIEDDSNQEINGHTIAAGGNETIVVTVEYVDGGAVADGDFTVDFGTTELQYSTVD